MSDIFFENNNNIMDPLMELDNINGRPIDKKSRK